MRAIDLPGAADQVHAAGVIHLAPEEAVFEAMLEGWATQQRSRLLARDTLLPRIQLIRRFAKFTNSYPWLWEPVDVEQFTAQLRSGPKPIRHSTARNYQGIIGLFCDYLTDARYAWGVECERRFGDVPIQICHEWNSVQHTSEYEGDPGRRAATYDEVQALFDAADARAERIKSRRRKGLLAALRDAVMIKTVYAFGIRRRELCMLDIADLRRNPKVPDYRRFGALEVRYAKATTGSPPRRRTVLLVPEFDWVVGPMRWWLEEVRPAFDPGNLPALWVTERRSRVQVRKVENFAEIRALAGVDDRLDLHSLRHSYVTHLLEFGYPELFVQQQVGHSYASTTAIYSSVSDGYRNRLLAESIKRQLAHHLGPEGS